MAFVNPLTQYTGAIARDTSSTLLDAGGSEAKDGDSEHISLLRQLLANAALQSKMLSASFGTESGVADRRNGQTYYIEVGVKIQGLAPGAPGDPPVALTPNVLVDTSRLSHLVSPSLGDVDISYKIGLDSFSVHRWQDPTREFPITISCPTLQAPANSRFFSQISGASGTALNGTAATILYSELPSSMNFILGFISPLPTDESGVLTTTIWPLVYNVAWFNKAMAGEYGEFPTVLDDAGVEQPLWTTSNIYAVTLRIYVIPQITPRVKIISRS